MPKHSKKKPLLQKIHPTQMTYMSDMIVERMFDMKMSYCHFIEFYIVFREI